MVPKYIIYQYIILNNPKLPYPSPYFILDSHGYIGDYHRITKKKLTARLLGKLRRMVCDTDMKILSDNIAGTCFKIDEKDGRMLRLKYLAMGLKAIGKSTILIYYDETY